MAYFNSHLAQTPPMGWNSWDCYSVSINEDELKANADFIAKNLKQHGWEYVVLDLGWYCPSATHETYKQVDIPVEIDEFGRFIPCPEKFPSSKGGKGLKPIADYIHSLGLKFGIHIMRGLPMKAVAQKTPVKGTNVTADQIAYEREACPWFNSLRTLNFAKPEAQAYYDSIFELYAQWGVDYIKADDVNAWHEVENSDGSPTGNGSPYRIDDIEGISQAIKTCGREMVLSLSPGGPETTLINHLRSNSNLWRISADFWDEWGSLKKQMERCAIWAEFATEGHWPDADMLPIGYLPRGESGGTNRQSNFNSEELHTLMSLWCMARSPLMIGADLPTTDSDTIKLLQNDAVLAINKYSTNNRLVKSDNGIDVWAADSTKSDNSYVALFNKNDSTTQVTLNLAEVGLTADSAEELWQRYEVQLEGNAVTVAIKPHDVVVLKV
ncbi:alpha-galactosidase [Saccharobesus litoralis]|uniref:Alpha-galactosidase n=1 Tax=Saccharobesus litoralis TaxID=2172099 RepID=A0A2S0VQ21_9ALTE|nr:glycoside hydrolase family 27 protein [Saccharobesus litoralis]AWB66299.1 alpha-galactosidase [Saccharobesus litoralis]